MKWQLLLYWIWSVEGARPMTSCLKLSYVGVIDLETTEASRLQYKIFQGVLACVWKECFVSFFCRAVPRDWERAFVSKYCSVESYVMKTLLLYCSVPKEIR